MAAARCQLEEIDNRDLNETYLKMRIGGLYPNVLELDRANAMQILKSFYVNAAQDVNGRVQPDKLTFNKENLMNALQDLLDFAYEVILQCGFDVDGGNVKEFPPDEQENFKKAFPEYTREMRRG